MDIPKHWKLYLDGYPDEDAGDVFTPDGEFLGTWSLVNAAILAFTPDGSDEQLFYESNVPDLVRSILGWHKEPGA